ncbi:MAG TPA: GGDEF domain-containing protein [Candidatus Angelobacter sp.]
MNAKQFRQQLHRDMKTKFHAGFLTDPAEENILDICGRISVEWCRYIRQRLVSDTEIKIGSVTFFSNHPTFNLVIAWSARDMKKISGGTADLIHSNVSKIKIFRQHSKYVPQAEYAGLSALFMAKNPGRIRGIYLHPGTTQLVNIGGKWITGDAGKTLDPPTSLRLGLRHRVYLPVGPCNSSWAGAFMVALDNGQIGHSGVKSAEKKVSELISAYEKYSHPSTFDPVLTSCHIMQPLWERVWESSRESRTLLPHQGGFKRVFARLLQDKFLENANPYLGVVHFDFNGFKRLNTIAGYEKADRLIERFIRYSCEELSKLSGGWPHPVSTSPGTWTALTRQADGPKIAWYFSRIGGDEFGLVYLAKTPKTAEVRKAFNEAIRKTEQNMRSWLRLSEPWVPQCMGSLQERRVKEILGDKSLPYEDLVDRLWEYMSRFSQQVKEDFRHAVRGVGATFFVLTLDQALAKWREGSIWKGSSRMKGVFFMPFRELEQYAKELPFLTGIETVARYKAGDIVMARLKRHKTPKIRHTSTSRAAKRR